MRFVVDESIIKKRGLTLSQFLFALSIKHSLTGKAVDELISKEVIQPLSNSGPNGQQYYVTPHWLEECDNILLSAEKNVPDESYLFELANKLRDIFPEGKKPGTNYYWKSNAREVVLKLKTFFKIYGNGYTEEEILTAARNYVDSYINDTTFMRILKHFIWKREKGGEEISELATFLDNAGQETADDYWTNDIV